MCARLTLVLYRNNIGIMLRGDSSLLLNQNFKTCLVVRKCILHLTCKDFSLCQTFFSPTINIQAKIADCYSYLLRQHFHQSPLSTLNTRMFKNIVQLTFGAFVTMTLGLFQQDMRIH